MKLIVKIAPVLLLILQLIYSATSFGYSVTQLTATYQKGQVFLTWKNPSATNLQYNIYRSTLPIVLSSQLTSGSYLGYVRDNSAKNIRKTELKNEDYYFVINSNQSPLASDRGLYVATCEGNLVYYYAITVTNLNNNKEDNAITAGANSLLLPVIETVAAPQAVLQTITNQSNGDVSYEYVIWGNNQDAPKWPAFNRVGSYGYNFTVQKRGSSTGKPLYVQFQDQNPFSKLDSDLCSDCNMLQLDDWLPNGENTYWVGYNDSYDMYASGNSNPIVTTGIINAYSQVKTQAIIRWTKRQSGIDSNRIYMTGNSHNGFGCMLTAMNMPAEIACIYPTSNPIIYKTQPGNKREHQFCKTSSNIPTDLFYPGTSNHILIWDVCDMRTWYRINKSTGVPYAQSIHGRNDTKAGWIQKFHWFDTLNAYRQGGTWFWDERSHGGGGAQFTDEETTPDYNRYYSNVSYPAFSYCTLNQDPGAGDPNEGDPYGAINGYLDWDVNSISDKTCTYSINCFIRDFYVGGELAPTQYDVGFTDITLRRTRKFNPLAGQTISWTNYGVNSNLLQSGSFVYNGSLITLYGIKIKRSGSTLTLTIGNCKVENEELGEQMSNGYSLNVFPNPLSNSTIISFSQNTSQKVSVKVYDLAGRLITTLADEVLNEGTHQLPWNATNQQGSPVNAGIYLLRIESANRSESIRLSVVK